MKADQSTEELGNLLLKFKRLETSLTDKIDNFVESQQEISDHSKKLTLEIEELKKLKISIAEVVDTAVAESVKRVLPTLLPPLIRGFEEKTKSFADSSIKDAQGLKQEIDQTIYKASDFISFKKREMTNRRLGIGASFCAASLITALSIFYFFPQHEYHTTHYALITPMAQAVVMGEAVFEDMEKLTPVQKEFFMKKAAQNLALKYQRGSK